MTSLSGPRQRRWRVVVLLVLVALAAVSAPDNPFSPREKAFFADLFTINFVRPGLVLKVTSAEITADGTISAVFTIADPRGLPLDREGIVTPGPVAVNFVAAFIPKDQEQYTAYTTRSATGAASGTVRQAGADTGGTYTKLADGQYRYTFGIRAPADFDRSVTHTIGIYGSRSLTEFDLGTNYASTTFNFIPVGGTVTVTRDVIRNQSCNRCHDDLAAHGGSRRGLDMCVLCHTPQTIDPDTGNSVDMKVMVHKIHAGKELPSVQAGKPYQIIGFGGSVFDWSSVGYPSNILRCESCHESTTGAAQANHWLTKPSRVACGSCHDNVDFSTGVGHVAGPEISDNQCSTCHIPQGELEFDASIKGAHLVPQDSAALAGLVVGITKVDNAGAGKQPAVTFTVRNNLGAGVPLAQLNSVSLILAGPTVDYGYTSFGADVTTPGYVSESATGATCTADGTCTFTFRRSVPADAKGTYAVGIEARRTETLLAGTTSQRNVQYGAQNKVFYFSVDGSPVAPRRTVVTTERCNQCHTRLTVHGENRNEVEHCLLCHNPSDTDAARRPTATDVAERAKPAQGINFPLLVHRIHSGEHLRADNRPYVVIGFGGSVNDFSHVRYPAMSLTGAPGERRNCSNCHVNGSEQDLARLFNDVRDPQGPIDPVKPVTSACTGCHVKLFTASHALASTSSLGESCETCHGSTSQFSVSRVHAQ